MESGRLLCLSVLSAKSKKTLIRKPPKSRKETNILNQVSETYEISPRFYRALEAKALSLENDARQDEAFAATLENHAHLQRQYLLIDTQRDQARRLRDFLAASRIRIG
jgi:5-bromo-4-chloroindolyl phosphate hydrolysis protein